MLIKNLLFIYSYFTNVSYEDMLFIVSKCLFYDSLLNVINVTFYIGKLFFNKKKFLKINFILIAKHEQRSLVSQWKERWTCNI